MSIEIIEDTIRISRADYDKYKREWEKACQYRVDPPTLEAFIRQQLEYKRLDV